MTSTTIFARALPIFAALLAAGCAGSKVLDLSTLDPASPVVSRIVDSPDAQRLLAEVLAEQHAAAPSDAPRKAIPTSLGATAVDNDWADANLPSQQALNAIGHDVSMDFAALTFARALQTDPRSHAVQEAFRQALADGPELSKRLLMRDGAFPYTVLIAPGWLYRSHPRSGADFARQRRLLGELGITTRLLPTAESGTVENNAEIIAAAIRDSAARDEDVLLVSASKAGPEVAFALSKLVEPAEVAHVVGWLNASSALHGTPLADWAVRPPVSWIVGAIFKVVGWSRDGIAALRTEPSLARLEGAHIADSIAVINLVAVPVSGTIGNTVRGGYWIMRKHGPTDGVVPIADSIWPGGVNLIALGSDHLLPDFRADPKALALLRAVDFAIRAHRCKLGSAAACEGAADFTSSVTAPR